jgi:hypothetical protein
MGTLDCVRQVRALDIPEADRASILGDRARALLGPSADAAPGTQRRP